MGLQPFGNAAQHNLVVITQRLGVTEVIGLREFHADDTDATADRIVEPDRRGVQTLLGKSRPLTGAVSVRPRRPDGALDENLSRLRLEMLVQQPDTEPPPRIGGDEILAQLFQTGAVVVAQLTDVRASMWRNAS